MPSTLPPIDRTQLWLLPIADAFMALMWSRPGGLSLRSTWVTAATIWLCLGVAVPAAGIGMGAARYGLATRQVIFIAGAAMALLLAMGTGSVALYGIRQRLLTPR